MSEWHGEAGHQASSVVKGTFRVGLETVFQSYGVGPDRVGEPKAWRSLRWS